MGKRAHTTASRHNTQLVNWISSLISLSCSLVNKYTAIHCSLKQKNITNDRIKFVERNPIFCASDLNNKNEIKSSKQISPQIFSSINQYQFAKLKMQAIWNCLAPRYPCRQIIWAIFLKRKVVCTSIVLGFNLNLFHVFEIQFQLQDSTLCWRKNIGRCYFS